MGAGLSSHFTTAPGRDGPGGVENYSALMLASLITREYFANS